jgi:membrane protein implicated in regulation of membrane protease activity
MKLDIRNPIGALFVTIGLILAFYGAASDPSLYGRSLGLNINLSWGIVLFAFGSLMLLLSWRAARRRREGEMESGGTRMKGRFHPPLERRGPRPPGKRII